MNLAPTNLGLALVGSATAPDLVRSRGIASQIAAMPAFAAKLNQWDDTLNATPFPARTDLWFRARDLVDRAKADFDRVNSLIVRAARACVDRGYLTGDVELSGWAQSLGIAAGVAVLIVALAIVVAVAGLTVEIWGPAVAVMIGSIGAAGGTMVLLAGAVVGVSQEAGPAVAAGLGVGALLLIGLGLFLLIGGRRG